MGCFSFICKESNEPIILKDAVYLFLLADGKVIEEMYGRYDEYARVRDENGKSYQWNVEWSDVCIGN